MIGWRKLGFGGAIVLLAFGFIYWKTGVHGNPPQMLVPDIPANVRDVIIAVFWGFVGGNAAGKLAQARGGKEPS